MKGDSAVFIYVCLRYLYRFLIGEYFLVAVTSVILAGSMGRRALRGGKFMPGGLIASLAVIAGAYNGVKSYEFRYGL